MSKKQQNNAKVTESESLTGNGCVKNSHIYVLEIAINKKTVALCN